VTPTAKARGAAAPPESQKAAGGGSARATRTREAVVDALLTLIDEGNLRPTARAIAGQAGVSLRSVYVHFDDVGDLFHAAARRHFENLESVVGGGIGEDDPDLDKRIDAFLERRADIYEASANIRRAALLQEPFSPTMQRIVEGGRKLARAHVDAVFGSDLHPPDSPQGAWERSALDVVSGIDAWEVLRRRQGLSDDEAKDVVRRLVRAVLTEKQMDRSR
jgi:TetR/AcrR family transcriptional regulator, regulator of autoinduction and epiphytic fitness